MRISSLRSVKANYEALIKFLESQTPKDCMVAAKVNGFLKTFESFDYIYFLNVTIELFDRIEILNKDLQSVELCVVDSYDKVKVVVDYLKNSKEEKVNSVWKESVADQINLSLDEPKLPRVRNAPSKLGKEKIEAPKTAELYYKNLAIQMYDNVFNFFEVRFNGESSHIFKALENIALKKESSKDTLKVKDAYKDLDFKQLIKDRDFFLII